MIDVLLAQSSDGGEVYLENGVITLDETPFTAAYLSLWGGNIEDAGTSATRSQMWWANFDEPDATTHVRSKTQALLISLPAITSNLVRIEEAAESDLAWMTDEIADSVTATASLPARNTVRLIVQIKGRDGSPHTFNFTRPWPPTAS